MAKKSKDVVYKGADKVLEILQKSFNTDSSGYYGIVNNLDYIKELSKNNSRIGKSNKIALSKLQVTVKDINILKDGELFNRVDILTGDYDGTAIKATDLLINDIKTARNWLSAYNRIIRELNLDSVSSRKEIVDLTSLEMLGRAILGRAIELCPKDTGNLRRSGFVQVTNNSVIVGFSAPYSIYVHENMNCYFRVGRAKFLEIALSEFLGNSVTWVDTEGGRIFAEIGVSKLV